jgi:hypothetical protein
MRWAGLVRCRSRPGRPAAISAITKGQSTVTVRGSDAVPRIAAERPRSFGITHLTHHFRQRAKPARISSLSSGSSQESREPWLVAAVCDSKEGAVPMIRRTRMSLLAGVAVLTIAGTGTGIAFAQGSDPPSAPPTGSPSPSPSPPSITPAPHGMRHGHGRQGGLLARIEHGEATVDTGNGSQVVDIQRGVVDSASPGQLTVRSTDGFTATYVVNNSTKIRKNRKASDISQVVAHDRVTVLATKTNNTATVEHITDTGAAK